MLKRSSKAPLRPRVSQSRRSTVSISNDASSGFSCPALRCNMTTFVIVVVVVWVLITMMYLYTILASSNSANNSSGGAGNFAPVANQAQVPLDKKEDIWEYRNDPKKFWEKYQKNVQGSPDISNQNLNPKPVQQAAPTAKPTQRPTARPTERPTAKPKLYYESHLSEAEAQDRNKVSELIEYWRGGTAVHANQNLRQSNGKYLTFWTDCGGFNNIRMAFEYFIIVAWITNRTLVLPPIHAWYLIDYGRLARMKTKDHSGVTEYSDFFNFDDLRMEVPVISTYQFIEEINGHTNYKDDISDLITVPAKFVKNSEEDRMNGQEINEWKSWLNSLADKNKYDMAWGPLGYILFWPSIQKVKEMRGEPPAMFRSNRKYIEYTDREKELKWVHFPSCTKGDPGTAHDYRYLGQVATFIWFAERNQDKELKRVLRDHVHMRDEIFALASHVIAKIGIFKYASMHIRRNELQYKESFITADATLSHVRPLLKPNETIYIATDETDPNFFKVIEREFHVLKWQDFFVNAASEYYIGDKVKVPRKWEGCVEMVICGAGRIFFGTDTSTFSSYITRLRGYFNAPDRNTYHHNEQWTGDPEKDGQKHRSLWGQTYMDEFPDMWESIQGSV